MWTTSVSKAALRSSAVDGSGRWCQVPSVAPDTTGPAYSKAVPGGGIGSVLRNPETMAWIKKVSGEAITMSVCNGALVLARAGLLEDMDATTHHGSIAALSEFSETVRVHPGQRFVDNGPVITSAGVSAGMDMAFEVVERLHGPDVANETARYIEYRRR